MKTAKTSTTASLAMAALASFASFGDVVVETKTFKLVVGDDAAAKSLVVKATGEECVDSREGIPLFTSTQERPFNNEIKLAHPNKRTTYRANRVRREGDLLVVGFAVAPYEAEVRVKERNGYALFTLEGFRTNTKDEKQYGGLQMDAPPVASFRVLQMPARNRANFGDWLNVSWDDRAAVAVVGADPYSEIDHEDRFGFRLLNADLRRDLKLKGGSAALVAGGGREEFLAAVEELENDLGLPHGVASRRNPLINASIYWTGDLTPQNVDEHIAWARKGGFRMMLIYYPSMSVGGWGYDRLGDYDWRPEYPNKEKDLKAVVDKIKAAGITPGFHTLQTHIGLNSRYVTPDADPRLNKTVRFTLAKPLPADAAECEVEVLEDTKLAVRHPTCRILQFGGELLSYQGFTETPPYKFTGVKRGHRGTRVREHLRGEVGGVLDVSEFGATSCYIDQRTDLQDEVAAKIAKIYDTGMEFCYFDGSEGVNPPCGVNVSLSQWRTVRAFKKPPLFTEGAAKSHFGWHLQAGANAFDIFPPELFKAKIVEYPVAEAPVMRQDFTRLDFGWWGFWANGDKFRNKTTIGTQPDMWEYGTSKAAAWDCPATIQANVDAFKRHARANDIMETMRRWEDVRARNLLTPAQKELLKDAAREYHLVPDGKGAYDMVEWEQLSVAGSKSSAVRAFLYEHGGKRVVEYWHVSGEGSLALPNGVNLAAGNVKAYETSDSAAAVRSAFAAATVGTSAGDEVKASSFGWNPADATKCLQAALDSGARRVRVDKQASEWLVDMVYPRSNTEIVFEDGVVVRAVPGSMKGIVDNLFRCADVSNVVMRGEGRAVIRMNREDYLDKTRYQHSEHRHAISLRNVENVVVRDLFLEDSGGDGVYVLNVKHALLENLVCSGHARQGTSLISVDDLTIRNCVFKHTKGALPECGMDIEPGRPTFNIGRVLIDSCVFCSNNCSGVAINVSNLGAGNAPMDVTYRNCRMFDNASRGVWLVLANGTHAPVKGDLRFEGCVLSGNRAGPLQINNLASDALHVSFKDCVFDASGFAGVVPPITLVNGRIRDDLNNLSFDGCRLVACPAGRKPVMFEAMTGCGVLPGGAKGILPVEYADGKSGSFDFSDLEKRYVPKPELRAFETGTVDIRRLVPCKADGRASAPQKVAGYRGPFTFLQYVQKPGEYKIHFDSQQIGKYAKIAVSVEVYDSYGTPHDQFTITEPSFDYVLKAQGRNTIYRFEVRPGGRRVLLASEHPGHGFVANDRIHWLTGKGQTIYFQAKAGAGDVKVELTMEPGEWVSAELIDPAGNVVDRCEKSSAGVVLQGKRQKDDPGGIWSMHVTRFVDDCLMRLGAATTGVYSYDKNLLLVEGGK